METPNLNYIKQLSEGDTAFESNLLGIIKNELPQEIAVFKQNFKANNLDECANNVHKIKHKISLLGMSKSLKMASVFETELRNKKISGYSDFIEVLNKILVYLGY